MGSFFNPQSWFFPDDYIDRTEPVPDIGRMLFRTNTRDGHLLDMYRYPVANGSSNLSSDSEWIKNKRISKPQAPKIRPRMKPILLIHSPGTNHKVWELAEELSLSYYLAREGFDVWAIDLRKKDPHNKVLLFDDYIKFDVPTAINYILEETGVESLHIIGHSMGATLGLSQLASPIGSQIASLTLMAGGCHYEHSAWRHLVPILPVMKLGGTIPLHSMSQLGSGPALLFGGMARFAVYGPNIPHTMLSQLMSTCFHSVPASISDQLLSLLSKKGLKASFFDMAPPPATFVSFQPKSSDEVIEIKFGEDDDDKIKDMEPQKVAGNTVWEDFMKSSPADNHILAVIGDKDMQAKQEDILKTLNATKSSHVQLEIMNKFGHFDIILGQRAKDEIFPKILSFLENLDEKL